MTIIHADIPVCSAAGIMQNCRSVSEGSHVLTALPVPEPPRDWVVQHLGEPCRTVSACLMTGHVWSQISDLPAVQIAPHAGAVACRSSSAWAATCPAMTSVPSNTLLLSTTSQRQPPVETHGRV